MLEDATVNAENQHENAGNGNIDGKDAIFVGITTRLIPNGIHETVYSKDTASATGRALRCRLVVTIGPKFEASELKKLTGLASQSKFNADLRCLPSELNRKLFSEAGEISAIFQLPKSSQARRPFPGREGNADLIQLELVGHRIFWGKNPASETNVSPYSPTELDRLDSFWQYLITGGRNDAEVIWSEFKKQASGVDTSSVNNLEDCKYFQLAKRTLPKPTADSVGSVLARRAYALLSEAARNCQTTEETGFCLKQAGNMEIGNKDFFYQTRFSKENISSTYSDVSAKNIETADEKKTVGNQQKIIFEKLKGPIEYATHIAENRLNFTIQRSPKPTALKSWIKIKSIAEETPDCMEIVSSIQLDSSVKPIQQENDRQRIQHSASTRSPQMAPKEPQDETAEEKKKDDLDLQPSNAVRQKIMHIQSNTRLARLFGLCCEVEFDNWNTLEEVVNSTEIVSSTENNSVDKEIEDDSENMPLAQQATSHFLFLTTRPQTTARNIWVLAKFRSPNPTDDKSIGHFYPCSREELDLAWLSGFSDLLTAEEHELLRAAVDHREGIIDLGSQLQCGDKRLPRYELTPLDAAPVVEAEINQEYGELERSQYEADPLRPEQTKKKLKEPDALDRTPLKTAGMLLLDRKMNVKIIDEIVRKSWRTSGCSGDGTIPDGIYLHDANDLMIGYSPDIAVKRDISSGGRLIWRSLSNRLISLCDPREAESDDYNWVDRFLSRHDEDFQSKVRSSSAVTQVSTTQLPQVTTPPPENEISNATADHLFVDQTVFRWTGDLVGVDTNPSVSEVDPKKDLPITEVHIPLDKQNSSSGFLPPPGRFGQSYWFGCRAVYAGGVKIPLAEASARYNIAHDGSLCLPKRSAPGKRCIRLDKLNAPVWLLKQSDVEAYARNHHNETYELPSSDQVILRTADVAQNSPDRKAIEKAFSTPSTTRILLPPSVTMDFAGRHGVFDGNRNKLFVKGKDDHGIEKTIPKGAYLNVRMDFKPAGGFPVADSTGKIHYERTEKKKNHEDREQPVFGYKPFEEKLYLSNSQGRYFPDPAANRLVLMVRRAADKKSYLGDPVTIAFGDRYLYPNLPAIHLNFETLDEAPDPEKAARKHSDVIHYADNDKHHGYLDRSMTFRKGAASADTTPAINVNIKLLRGEDVDIVAWFAPSAAQLRHWFEIVESASTLLSCRNGKDQDACKNAIKSLFKGVSVDMPDLKADLCVPDSSCGISGHARPSEAILQLLAEALAKLILKQPLLQISSISTMRAVHAVSKPNFAPLFTRLTQNQTARLAYHRSGNLAYLRRHWTLDDKKDPEVVRESFLSSAQIDTWGRKYDQDENSLETKAHSHELDATDVTLGGRILADVDTSGEIQLVGDLFSPFTEAMDDPSRGLTDKQLETIFEIYQDQVDLPPNDAQSLEKKKIAQGILNDQFGYHVTVEGSVIPKRSQVDLLRLYDIALRDSQDDLLSGVETVDLNLHYEAKGSDESDGRAVRKNVNRAIFSDTLARQITNLRLIAKSRFKDYFTIKPPEEKNMKENQNYEDLYTKSKYLIFDATSTNDNEGNSADNIWLPATSRPAKLDLLSSTPSFLWEYSHEDESRADFTLTRKSKVRIYIKRPWFSSGEGEKLGLVLWPPELFGGRHEAGEDIANPHLPEKVLDVSDYGLKFPNQSANNPNNSDSNAPELWTSYVTRWGNDPIRSGPHTEGWFVPKDVFDDIPIGLDDKSHEGDGSPVLIPSVKIPLPTDDDKGETERTYFQASLLTYDPKFDVENRVWYVDLGLDPLDLPFPFMRMSLVRYQPRAIGDLQVSEPVVQWCQLVPQRHVTATKKKIADKHYVDVSVYGRASDTTNSRPFRREFGLGLSVDPTDRPSVKMSLRVQRPHPSLKGVVLDTSLQEYHDALGSKRAEIPDSWESQRQEKSKLTGKPVWVDEARSEHGGLLWQHLFELDEEPDFPEKPSIQRRQSIVYHYIYVEETQRMLSTENENRNNKKLEKTGPRFSAVIPLRIGPLDG